MMLLSMVFTTAATYLYQSIAREKDFLAHKQIYGIALGSGVQEWSQQKLETTFKGIKDLGMDAIRFDISWSILQPKNQDVFLWEKYDKVITTAKKYDLKSLVILDYTPQWARSSKCKATQMCPPANDTQFANYAAAVADRYSKYDVHTYEVWNEENSHQFWASGANVSEYKELLHVTAQAIKKADDKAIIIMGGLSPAGDPSEAIAPRDFVRQIYELGGKMDFDAIAYHPYTSPFLISQKELATNWLLMDGTADNLRAIMKTNGDEGKNIWVTEYGAATGGSGLGADTQVDSPYYDHVSEEMQATMAREAVANARTKPWLKGFFWYTYYDEKKLSSDREGYFGLMTSSGKVKPAYYQLQQSIKNNK